MILSALNNLIEEVNKISSQITELTARGSMEKKSALAGINYEINFERLKRITTQPMEGR